MVIAMPDCGVTAPSPASFDLCADGGIGGPSNGRLRPRGTVSGDAKEREQDEGEGKFSPTVGHRSPIRVSQLAARKRRDYATILTKINRPSQAYGPSHVHAQHPPSASLLLAHRIKAKRPLFDEIAYSGEDTRSARRVGEPDVGGCQSE